MTTGTTHRQTLPPHLDWDTCDRARLARARAFDGLFFSGVRSTRIYCRPVCPVRPARSENVTFYPTAAAAERAGFRPCLRCRPETAPFCPAWKGTRTTVERALKLIDDGVLDHEGIPALAERLGIGPRHLSRLFAEHLDASPLQVALTLRVQRAKRLLDTTELAIPAVAERAGFSNARRMSDAYPRAYGRSPAALRAKRSKNAK